MASSQSPGDFAPGSPVHQAPTIEIQESSPRSGPPAVRFSSVNQEISAEQPFGTPEPQHISASTEADLRHISSRLHGTHLQQSRMNQYAYEPVSLPASRVASNDDSSSNPASREQTRNSSGRPSPRHSPRLSMNSPPLTPAATSSRDGIHDIKDKGAPLQKVDAEEDPNAVTPQLSPQIASRTSTVHTSRPPSSGQNSTRPTSLSGESGEHTHRRGVFSIGPGDTSSPVSRETSPSRTTPTYSRPFTPAGDINDPYAAKNRPPQSKNLDNIDPRFVFTRGRHRASPSASSTNLPKSSLASSNAGEKRHSFIFGGGKKDHNLSHLHDEGGSSTTLSSKHNVSMSDLKRFMKLGPFHKSKRTASPAPSAKSSVSGTQTPPHHRTPQQLPFGDDHGLASKYGKFGKVLGSGAGGSVRVMKRSSDGVTFAVKEFRARHSYESEKEYAKKVTAEFCVGSTLHHGNIIETLDIVQEKGRWYEVMEYAPYDLFAIVMTGKMSREEVCCSFLQILSGVTYLHSMGLAHRDLKLDNVVVNEHGIMKIIDFGSACVFKYPFENEIVLASGIVGSDPYLAPEVYDERKYDPQPTDIWSLAIIFCCMSLRRFPWKIPRMTDNSYKLFASPPTPGTDMRRVSDLPPSKSASQLTDVPARDTEAVPQRASSKAVNGSEPANGEEKKPEVIKGPWRLLRLLPRESRQIIGKMLQIDPKQRATMSDILDDPWVANTPICRQLPEGGRVIKAEGHTHTLEPPQAPSSK